MKLSLFTVLFFLAVGAAGVYAQRNDPWIYDWNKPLKIRGNVTRIDWVDPVHVHVKGTDEIGGAKRKWDVETGVIRAVGVAGWKEKDQVKVGDAVVVEAFAAKDGSEKAILATLYLENGTPVYDPKNVPRGTGSPPPVAPPTPLQSVAPPEPVVATPPMPPKKKSGCGCGGE